MYSQNYWFAFLKARNIQPFLVGGYVFGHLGLGHFVRCAPSGKTVITGVHTL